jgi:hypothetical protein
MSKILHFLPAYAFSLQHSILVKEIPRNNILDGNELALEGKYKIKFTKLFNDMIELNGTYSISELLHFIYDVCCSFSLEKLLLRKITINEHYKKIVIHLRYIS